MKRLLVLGAGTAGTMAVNRLRRRLSRATGRSAWSISTTGTTTNPATCSSRSAGTRPTMWSGPRERFIPAGVDLVYGKVDRVVAGDNEVLLADGTRLPYDYLVVATGVEPRPDQTPGMLDGGQWRESIFDFYTFDGVVALADALRDFDGGRLVVHIVDMPIKCPVAPLEFTFLADAYFRRRGMRDRVDLVYATPLPGAFTKPIAARRLGSMLDDRTVAVEADFLVERVEGKALVSYDEREIPFDLLVTVPLNMGADYVARSGLGNELNLVPVDRHTLLSKAYPNIFAVGDANDIPASKAGSVAHFSIDVFTDNFLRHVCGEPMTGSFDGHANCFVESGDGKGLLIDFNYDTEPLPGRYPIPGVGPFSLLKETAVNHWGKLAFRWMYWNLLLPGRPIPLPAHMSMAGKHPRGVSTVPVTTIAGRDIHVDDEGFLAVPDEWDDDLARQLAAQIGIDLTDAHWKAIRFLRADHAAQGETPALRRVSVVGGIPTRDLFTLFPKKPAKKMAYIAGLPKPHGCV